MFGRITARSSVLLACRQFAPITPRILTKFSVFKPINSFKGFSTSTISQSESESDVSDFDESLDDGDFDEVDRVIELFQEIANDQFLSVADMITEIIDTKIPFAPEHLLSIVSYLARHKYRPEVRECLERITQAIIDGRIGYTPMAIAALIMSHPVGSEQMKAIQRFRQGKIDISVEVHCVLIAQADTLEEKMAVIKRMEEEDGIKPNVTVYNLLIHKRIMDGIEYQSLLDEMKKAGIQQNGETYAARMFACKTADQMKELTAELDRSGIEKTIEYYTICGYHLKKTDKLKEHIEVMKEKDILITSQLFNAFFRGCDSSEINSARAVMREEEIRPTVLTYNLLMKRLPSSIGRFKKEMDELGIVPDVDMLKIFEKNVGELGQKAVDELKDQMIRIGYQI